MFKLCKVFDCQKMPQDVKRYLFDHYGEGKSNDCYINIWIEGNCNSEDNHECECECETCEFMSYDIVEQWLLDNGATVEDNDILVKRWW
jgi:hypothetical protein